MSVISLTRHTVLQASSHSPLTHSAQSLWDGGYALGETVCWVQSRYIVWPAFSPPIPILMHQRSQSLMRIDDGPSGVQKGRGLYPAPHLFHWCGRDLWAFASCLYCEILQFKKKNHFGYQGWFFSIHYSSFQSNMMFSNQSNMLICCCRNISSYHKCWKQLCCWK